MRALFGRVALHACHDLSLSIQYNEKEFLTVGRNPKSISNIRFRKDPCLVVIARRNLVFGFVNGIAFAREERQFDGAHIAEAYRVLIDVFAPRFTNNRASSATPVLGMTMRLAGCPTSWSDDTLLPLYAFAANAGM